MLVRSLGLELATRLVHGRTLAAKVLHDASVGLDYLESRSEVDATNPGFITIRTAVG